MAISSLCTSSAQQAADVGAPYIVRRVGLWDVYERAHTSGPSFLSSLAQGRSPRAFSFVAIASRVCSIPRILRRLIALPWHCAYHLVVRLRTGERRLCDETNTGGHNTTPAVKGCAPAQLIEIVCAQPGHFALYLLAQFLASVALPSCYMWLTAAASLSTPLEGQGLNYNWLLVFAITKLASRLLKLFVNGLSFYCERQLRRYLKGYLLVHIVKARARLDVLTSSDEAVNNRLTAVDDDSPAAEQHEREQAWLFLSSVSTIVTSALALGSTLVVVGSQISEYSAFVPLVLAALMRPIVDIIDTATEEGSEWWSVPRSAAYMKLRGLQRAVTEVDAKDHQYRHDIVAGNMQQAIERECDRLATELGESAIFDYDEHERRDEQYLSSFFGFRRMRDVIIAELPHIVLAFLVVRSPGDLSLLIGSFAAIEAAQNRVNEDLSTLTLMRENFRSRLESVNSLMSLADLENKIPDGPRPFPENVRDVAQHGVAVEFRNVWFRYSDTAAWSLRDVSFRVERGQLAVLVGTNGSGKSTILKLLARLYDPQHGAILLDGQDIRTLRLEDLRNTLAVMFQACKLLPLSLRDNIVGIRDPGQAVSEEDLDAVLEAAGVDFLDEQNQTRRLDAYLTYPVKCHGEPPKGVAALYEGSGLSGGQTQKIFAARLLMRLMRHDEAVGLVLLDEITSALDPKAAARESFLLLRVPGRSKLTSVDLHASLQRFRGRKTMLYSTHEYGKLTRDADVVFYMENGQILERGSHRELLQLDGGYARMWHSLASGYTD
ncbi:P-loop containing nucleoside triphosphate hydrolase protein [Exidia glandulosa HHB12029]|uniref:p-loop containing nucleoside triphosphate hydrolase protein n=1 Tax=Exidia glandulosa HHB12029 TaxID=1314781 RepID=A0A165PMB8_EXIGL|nr:P-loop containing nucleoside triphosphate hydrolase protein [Exidia glandulosa HHB12029]